MDSVYLSPEHEMFRDQIRRFVAEEVRPNADAWEAAGEIPREVFRRIARCMGLDETESEDVGHADLSAGTVALYPPRDPVSRFATPGPIRQERLR